MQRDWRGSAPLENSTRGFMEKQFGHDFSHVRIHHDAPMDHVAPGMDAYAVTRGSDIYFSAGSYAPEESFGRQILAHELAHVVQNDSLASPAGVSDLESEAEQAASHVAEGRPASVQHASKHPALAVSGRAKKTLKSAALVGAVGAGIGAIAASQIGGVGIGAAVGAGALIGGLIGAVYGFSARRQKFVDAPEADQAIQKRFGDYVPDDAKELNNARVIPVDRPRLCQWYRCRNATTDCPSFLHAWVDRGSDPPAANAENELKCGDDTIEHATPEQPVIYYDKDNRHIATLVHEGLHAYAHQSFQASLTDGVEEGATEYFTRQICSDLNIARTGIYEQQLFEVTRMLPYMGGEETLKKAYFKGEVDTMATTMDQQLGDCAMTEWAVAVQLLNFDREGPQRIIDNKAKKPNYCVGE